jgi:DNA-binding CsgD family transcriptional regulator
MNHAGFIHELDVFTEADLEEDPVYSGFYRKHGLGWAAGTMFPMPTGDLLVFSFERKYSLGPIERDVIEQLDMLRPHLGRAGLLAWRLGLERANAMTQALEQIGLPAAVLRSSGKLTAANESFAKLIPNVLTDRAERVRFSNLDADAVFATALGGIRSSGPKRNMGKSFPIAPSEDRPGLIFHLLPLRGAANDIFSQAEGIMIVTPVNRELVPTAEILQGLFDLTPAEARVARAISGGKTIQSISKEFDLSPETIRSQLKAVLRKTGLHRQAELVSTLASVALSR